MARTWFFPVLAAGTFEFYFDGSDVGLSTSGEDVDGLTVADQGDIYLTTRCPFAVSGLNGHQADIFVCDPGSLGSSTSCTFTLFWDGDAAGIGGERTDGIWFDFP